MPTRNPYYTEGASAPYTWVAEFNLPTPSLRHDLLYRMYATALDFTGRAPLVGAVIGRPGSKYKHVVLGLDPSVQYGTPTVTMCEEVARPLEEVFGFERSTKHIPGLHIIMGRKRGYRHNDYVHSMPEVQAAITARGIGGLTLREAYLFSYRINHGDVRKYQEHAVVVTGQAGRLNNALFLAHDLGQERVVAAVAGKTQAYNHI